MSKVDKIDSATMVETTRLTKETQLAVPRHCTLDGFAEETALRGGIEIAGLPALTKLTVETHNSTYRITLLDPSDSRALVQGGQFFVQPSEVYLCGSSYGGTLLKMAWIGNGMRMEIMSDGRRIVTSPVASAEIVDDRDLPGPY
jgi:hypothetical protein